ncbi:WRKY domain [Dillenia turbinata]|uniref:WRKY domain n=1 Tax=Dillenia turbinata TaxID=194707 RepID=A0AAN8VT37_9MAGN
MQENYSMNEITYLVYLACKAARELESNLRNLANNPNLLHKSCEEVIQLFANARDRLIMTDDNVHDEDTMFSDQGHHQLHHASSSQSLQPPHSLLPEWLRFSSSSQPPLDIHHVIHAQRLLGGKSPAPENKIPASETDHEMAVAGGGLRVLELGGCATSMDISTTFTGALVDIQRLNSAAASSSAVQRTRRRKNEAERETRFVPAPRVGNTEIPPEDGYTWRKYGQKDILNSRFPSS